MFFGRSFCWSEKVCCLEDVGILHRARMKICIIEPFPAYGKVGVNQKIFSAWIWVVFEGPNLCALHHLIRTNLIVGSEKNRLKWKTLKWRTRQYAQFLLCHCKNLAIGRWRDFPPEKFYFEIFSKTNAVSIYSWTKMYSWAKFNRNWFSDPKRSGPVLGRLPLDIGITPKHWLTNFATDLFSFLT